MSRSISTLHKLNTKVSLTQLVNNPNIVQRSLNSIVSFYEECIGLSEVHKARSDVTKVFYFFKTNFNK